MHGRSLTRGLANVISLDLELRNHRHNHTAAIYGFNRVKSIAAQIQMEFKSTIKMLVMLVIRANDIHGNLRMRELRLNLFKNIRADVHMAISGAMNLNVIKHIRAEPNMEIKSNMDVRVFKNIRAEDIHASFIIGAVNQGRLITDIENCYVSDIEHDTVEEICEGLAETRHGLRLGVVKMMYISDIEDLKLAHIQNRTINDISMIRVI